MDLPSGWLSQAECDLLLKTAAKTLGPIVEVGSFKGRSAVALASLKRPVYCIDPWEDGFSQRESGQQIWDQFVANTQAFPNITAIRKRVEDCAPFVAGFVYLDGDHSYAGTRFQIEWALECEPEWIAVHDVNDRGQGVYIKRAALELLGPWHTRVERLAVWEGPFTSSMG